MTGSLLFRIPRHMASPLLQHIDDDEIRERLITIHAGEAADEYTMTSEEFLAVDKAISKGGLGF